MVHGQAVLRLLTTVMLLAWAVTGAMLVPLLLRVAVVALAWLLALL
jgi:hypothetical protein